MRYAHCSTSPRRGAGAFVAYSRQIIHLTVVYCHRDRVPRTPYHYPLSHFHSHAAAPNTPRHTYGFPHAVLPSPSGSPADVPLFRANSSSPRVRSHSLAIVHGATVGCGPRRVRSRRPVAVSAFVSILRCAHARCLAAPSVRAARRASASSPGGAMQLGEPMHRGVCTVPSHYAPVPYSATTPASDCSSDTVCEGAQRLWKDFRCTRPPARECAGRVYDSLGRCARQHKYKQGHHR